MKHFLTFSILLTTSFLWAQSPTVLSTNPVNSTGTAYPCVALPGQWQYGGVTTSTITVSKDLILYAKLQDGAIVRYHYSANEPCAYEDRYPELSKSLEYVGYGRVWTYNGVPKNDTIGPDTYFWRKK